MGILRGPQIYRLPIKKIDYPIYYPTYIILYIIILFRVLLPRCNLIWDPAARDVTKAPWLEC